MRSAESRLVAVALAISLCLTPAASQPLADASLRSTGKLAVRSAVLAMPPRPLPRPLPPAHVSPGKLKLTRLVVPIPRETAAFKRTFRILLGKPELTDRYDALILRHARRHGLDPRVLKAIMAAESEFNPLAKSPAGALGLMQLMPATARGVGVPRERLTDPDSNIEAGAAYLAVLYKAAWIKFKLKGVPYQDAPVWLVQRIVASYHAGPRFLDRNDFLPQSKDYVRKVLLFYRSEVTELRRAPLRGKQIVSWHHPLPY